MLIKIHQSANSEVIALCDEDLIGKTLKSEKLTIKVSKQFYQGQKLSEEETLNILKTARNINILGKQSISFALKHKIIKKENIIKIENVPHAQVYS